MSEFTCPDGESVRHMAKRVNDAVNEIVKANAGKNILIATHATPIRAMGCVWNNMELSEISSLGWVANASVTTVEYDSATLGFRLINYAFCEHLEKENLITRLPKNI